MPLAQFDQGQLSSGNDEKSCGAASILVILNELGKETKLTKVLAMAIYMEIQKACLDESPLGNVATHVVKKGLKAVVIENTTVTTGLLGAVPALQGAYDEYLADMKKNKLTPTKITSYTKGQFDGDARVMLVVSFMNKGAPAQHYVLARRTSGTDYSVMNPDGGVETAIKEADLLSFMNTVGKQAKFGKVTYSFTGLCVQVKK